MEHLFLWNQAPAVPEGGRRGTLVSSLATTIFNSSHSTASPRRAKQAGAPVMPHHGKRACHRSLGVRHTSRALLFGRSLRGVHYAVVFCRIRLYGIKAPPTAA